MSASQILTIDDYFSMHGRHHLQKATDLLQPLHAPGRDPLPDFARYLRQPFDAQAHVVAAMIRALDESHSVILASEMGTGKTMMGMLASDLHARRSARKGGSNGRYRAMVLCPDHLILKWKDEILRTIPDASVTTFDVEGGGGKQLLKDMIHLYDRVRGDGHRWRRPEGPEWFVLGSTSQSKLMPGVSSLGSKRRGFPRSRDRLRAEREVLDCGVDNDGEKVTRVIYPPDAVVAADTFEHGSSCQRIIRFEDKEGRPQKQIIRIYRCPRCGDDLCGKKGEPIDLAESSKMLACGHHYAVEIPDPERHTCGLDVWPTEVRFRERIRDRLQKMRPGTIISQGSSHGEGKKKFEVRVCGEPLWQYVAEPRRWAPAQFMAKKLPRLFDYLVADEIHLQKGKATAQANAFGALARNSRNVIALTGTLIGGYARDIFYILLRTGARPLLMEGFGWGSDLPFTREYGRIETITTIRTKADGTSSISKGRKSMAKDETKDSEERPAPGVMPALFGRHLIGRSVFLALEDLAADLPELREYVGGPPEEGDEFWHECALEMSEELGEEYRRVEGKLAAKCTELLQHGSMKLLGQLLVATLGYCDLPFGWKAPTGREDHLACGYWDLPRLRTPGNWIGVVQPKDLPQDVIYPKEQALLEIVEKEVLAGNQAWIYVQMSDKRDVRPRLAKLLKERGMDVEILRSGSKGGPKPKDRIKWIEEKGRTANVIISHPQLVETGMDFFGLDPAGNYNHNFNSIVFYETGYNVFTLRQAARRAWRIGQRRACRIYYLYYKGTGQARAMQLIARKLDAAQAIDGQFSAEGLAATADETSAAMALARSIAEKIDDAEIGRNWAKVGAKPKLAAAALPEGPIEGLDILSMEADLLSQTLLEYDSRSPTVSPQQLAALYDELLGGWNPDNWDDLDFDPDALIAACT